VRFLTPRADTDTGIWRALGLGRVKPISSMAISSQTNFCKIERPRLARLADLFTFFDTCQSSGSGVGIKPQFIGLNTQVPLNLVLALFFLGIEGGKPMGRGCGLKSLSNKSRAAGPMVQAKLSIRSAIKEISPLIDRLMLLIKEGNCVVGEEINVEIALREAVTNAVLHVGGS